MSGESACVSGAETICDQTKWVWSQSKPIFICLIVCIHHLQSYLLQQTPLKLANWFQRYMQLKGCKTKQNKTKQKQTKKQIISFIWLCLTFCKISIWKFWLNLLDHSRSTGGAWGGICPPPSWRFCSPLAPSEGKSEGKQWQNQPFLAIFWIFALSDVHFACLVPPTKQVLVLPLLDQGIKKQGKRLRLFNSKTAWVQPFFSFSNTVCVTTLA